MKHFKTPGLLVVAAAALTAFAGSASATTLTSPTGTTYTGTITATAGVTARDGAFTTITCSSSHLEGSVSQHGADVTTKVSLSTLSFNGCNFPTIVEAAGSLEIHPVRPGVSPHATCLAGDGDKCDGTVTSSNTKLTMSTSVGNCTFTTKDTPIGTLTASSTTGGKAVLDIQGNIPRTEGNFLCGSSATWTGSYTFDTPSTFWIDE